MSYEGFTVCICKNGHLFNRDAYDSHSKCSVCEQPVEKTGEVDDE
jgi:hypothetical protein